MTYYLQHTLQAEQRFRRQHSKTLKTHILIQDNIIVTFNFTLVFKSCHKFKPYSTWFQQ